MLDNLSIIWESFTEKSSNIKIAIVAVLLSLLVGSGMWVNMVVTKLPAGISCTWDAYTTYSLDYDRWRFNWLQETYDKQCQRKRKSDDEWSPMEKVSDVGVGGDDVEVEG